MSSPAANLRKPKRSPLPHNRSVPFRRSLSKNEILNFMEEDPLRQSNGYSRMTGSVDELRTPDRTAYHTAQKQIVDSIKREHKNAKKKTAAGVATDSELLGSMASRLALVERELLAAKREVIEKDNYIHQLEERLATLEQSTETQKVSRGYQGHQAKTSQELELKCLALQKQVDEMEEFLNDYGMVWVGGSGDESHSKQKLSNQKSVSDGLWVPLESVTDREESVAVDFDAVVRNVEQLNVIAGGERTQVITTSDKHAKLKPIDSIPLILYKNGIVMFQGPFRPFSDPHTRQCIQDLLDGYYPSELQSRYPDGVPFQLTDRRDVTFKPREYSDVFPGSGRQLGGDKGPSKLLPSGVVLRHGSVGCHEEETSVLPGPKMSVESFLSRLPASVVKSGRVLDVRAGVAEAIYGTSSKVTLVEMPVLQEIKSRLDFNEDSRPPTPVNLTTLRIKSELGEQTYVLKMKCSETIGDVKRFITKLRPPGSPQSFLLRSTFPPRTFTNLSATLSECGLTPNANLFMAKASPSQN